MITNFYDSTNNTFDEKKIEDVAFFIRETLYHNNDEEYISKFIIKTSVYKKYDILIYNPNCSIIKDEKLSTIAFKVYERTPLESLNYTSTILLKADSLQDPSYESNVTILAVSAVSTPFSLFDKPSNVIFDEDYFNKCKALYIFGGKIGSHIVETKNINFSKSQLQWAGLSQDKTTKKVYNITPFEVLNKTIYIEPVEIPTNI